MNPVYYQDPATGQVVQAMTQEAAAFLAARGWRNLGANYNGPVKYSASNIDEAARAFVTISGGTVNPDYGRVTGRGGPQENIPERDPNYTATPRSGPKLGGYGGGDAGGTFWYAGNPSGRATNTPTMQDYNYQQLDAATGMRPLSFVGTGGGYTAMKDPVTGETFYVDAPTAALMRGAGFTEVTDYDQATTTGVSSFAGRSQAEFNTWLAQQRAASQYFPYVPPTSGVTPPAGVGGGAVAPGGLIPPGATPPAGGTGTTGTTGQTGETEDKYGLLNAYLAKLGLGGKSYLNPAENYQKQLFNPLMSVYGLNQALGLTPGQTAAAPDSGAFTDFVSRTGIGNTWKAAQDALARLFNATPEQQDVSGYGFQAGQNVPDELKELLQYGLKQRMGNVGTSHLTNILNRERDAWGSAQAAGQTMPGSFLDYFKQKYNLSRYF